MTKKKIIVIIIVALLLVAVISFGLYNYIMEVRESEESRAYDYVYEMHDIRTEKVTEYFDSTVRSLRVVADTLADSDEVFTDEIVDGYIYTGGGEARPYSAAGVKLGAAARSLLSNFVPENDMDHIAVANTEGIYYLDRVDGKERVFADVSGRAFFKKALSAKTSVVEHVAEPYVVGERSIVLSIPIVNGDTVKGVLLIGYYRTSLGEVFKGKAIDWLSSAIVDSKNNIITEGGKVDTDSIVASFRNNDYKTLHEGGGEKCFSVGNNIVCVGSLALGSLTIADGSEWFIVSSVANERVMSYVTEYGKRTGQLVVIAVLMMLLFCAFVIVIASITYKQKSEYDIKQSYMMSKFGKYVFDISPQAGTVTFSDNTRKLFGLKHNVCKIDDLRDERVIDDKVADDLARVLDNLEANDEAVLEMDIAGKHLRADIFHIVSKKENINCYTGLFEDITSIVLKQKLLEKKASTDGLTKLPNRESFVAEVEKNIAVDPATRKALYVIDIDEFKQINDKYGHYIGDILLQKVAAAINSFVSQKHIKLGRLGGDEFCIYFYGGPSNKEIREFGEELCNKLSMITISEDVDYYISCSIGISIYPRHGASFVDLYQSADNALYRAKEVYGSCYEIHDGSIDAQSTSDDSKDGGVALHHAKEDNFSLLLTQGTEGLENLRKILSDGIKNGEFVCYKQPKISLRDGTVASEALSRWINPTFGKISPNKFILLFERTKAIEELDMYMLDRTMNELHERNTAGKPPLHISVNQSLQTITQPYYYNKVLDMLKNYDVSPKYITIEITERGLFTGLRTIMKVIKNLHQCGFRISIDDFGSGFTTLSILKDLDVDEIKIDKSFMTFDSRSTQRSEVIIRQITKMAHELRIDVVTEGVETYEQAHSLYEMGVDYLQGYYISKPIPSDEFAAEVDSGKYDNFVQELDTSVDGEEKQ